MGAGFPGTFTAQVSPAVKEGRPSAGMLIPGNIKSAPPMIYWETSPPFSMKEGKSSGTFQSAKTEMGNHQPKNCEYLAYKLSIAYFS